MEQPDNDTHQDPDAVKQCPKCKERRFATSFEGEETCRPCRKPQTKRHRNSLSFDPFD